MTTLYLHQVMAIGSSALPAPQATLMATIIKGLLSQNLPWGLVLVGVFISVTLELCGIHSLSFAVGSYLPIATTAPIFAGGLVRAYVETRRRARRRSREVGAGTLFSSGLIAGGSLAGILYAILFGRNIIRDAEAVQGLVPFIHEGTGGMVAGACLFLVLAIVLARAAQRQSHVGLGFGIRDSGFEGIRDLGLGTASASRCSRWRSPLPRRRSRRRGAPPTST